MRPKRRFLWIKAMTAACLVAGLGACVERFASEASVEPEVVAEVAPFEMSPAAVEEVVDTRAEAAAGTRAEAAADTQIAVIPPRKPLSPPLDPEALIGSNEAEVTKALGMPNDTRTKAPATIWIYGDGECGLDLYYFLDVSGNNLRVLSYRLRTVEDSEAMRRDCLRELNRRT